MVLGNMETGLNTQNLMAILVVVVLSLINIFGLKTGALIQNVFTFAKVSALLGLVFLGLFIGRNAQALRQIFREISGTTRAWVRSTRCRWEWAVRRCWWAR